MIMVFLIWNLSYYMALLKIDKARGIFIQFILAMGN